MSPYLSPKNCITSLRDFTSAYGTSVQLDAGVFEDAFVDEFLDVGDLLRRERRAVEIEGQLVRPDEGTFLRRFLAHDFMQRPVQQMRDGVVALDGIAARLSTESVTLLPKWGAHCLLGCAGVSPAAVSAREDIARDGADCDRDGRAPFQ